MTVECTFDAATVARYDRLSASARQFLEHVEASPEMLERSSFRELEERRTFAPYPLLPWPVFLDDSVARQLEEVMAGLTRLVKEVPATLLGGDASRFADLYGFSERDAVLLSTLLRSAPLVDGQLARGDFLLTEEGLRCLEINFDANLGGWQNDRYAGLYRSLPALAPFFDRLGRAARCTSAPRALFRHVTGSFLARHRLEDDCLDTVVVKAEDKDVERLQRLFGAEMSRVYGEVLDELRPGLAGRIAFCRFSQLSERGGRLSLAGRPVQIVVEHCRGHVARPVLAAWLAGNALVLNGPLTNLFDDKRNLALLSEHADDLPPADRALVASHVPWTRLVRPGFVGYRGERRPLGELLLRERRRFVLKSARGKAGEGVRLGCALDEEAWRRTVEEALATGGWVVQERVESLPFAIQTGERGYAAHDVVWGLFRFGDVPGGGFLRGRCRPGGGEEADSPINTARGARESVYFEVEDPPDEPARRPVSPAVELPMEVRSMERYTS